MNIIKHMANRIIESCGGLIVQDVNTTVDVGLDQIRIEASKFGNFVSKLGVPLKTFSDYININEDKMIKNYITPEEISNIISKNNLKYDIDHNNTMIFSNNDLRFVISKQSSIDSNELLYNRLSKNNPNFTTNRRDFESDFLVKEKTKEEIEVTYFLEDNFSQYGDSKIIDQIKSYFEFKYLNGEEVNVLENVKSFIDRINFDGLPMERIEISNRTIKIRNSTNSLILVQCFVSDTTKSNKINSYKGALTDKGLPEDLKKYLENNHFQKEGEGEYAAVYSDPNHNIVLKITTSKTMDKAYEDFATFCRENKSPHLPKMGKVRKFDNYYVLPIEKLSNGQSSNFFKTCQYLDEYGEALNSGNVEEQESIKSKEFPEEYKNQKTALLSIIDKLKDLNHKFDLHGKNMMLRGSTIVITDPLIMDE